MPCYCCVQSLPPPKRVVSRWAPVIIWTALEKPIRVRVEREGGKITEVQLPCPSDAALDQQNQLCKELKKRQASDQPERDVIRLAAFNIEIFGVTKFGKPEVVEVLSRVSKNVLLTFSMGAN